MNSSDIYDWFPMLLMAVSIVFFALLQNSNVQKCFGREKISRARKVIVIFLIYSGFEFLQNYILRG